MNELFDFPPERTEYVDEGYAVVGRALTYASMFERDSKSLIMLVEAMKNHNSDSDETVGLITRALSQPLGAAHREIIDLIEGALDLIIDRFGAAHDGIMNQLGIPDPHLTLAHGREARNWLAHEATVGLQSRIDDFDDRPALIREIGDAVEKIARAHVIVLGLTSGLTNEDVPRGSFLDRFPATVSQWVCEV